MCISLPSPASTAAKNWARLRRYAAYLERQCPGLPTAKEIYTQLRDISFLFRDDFFAFCTESGTQSCHLVDKFDCWNQFLAEVNMELSEREPGRFGLNDTSNEVEEKKRSYLLLHWLLKQHCCIKTLWIVKPFPPGYLHLFCDALWLNRGLEELVFRCALDEEALKAIVPAVGKALKSLVKLEISVSRTPGCPLGPLGTALLKAESLASLDVYGIHMDACNAELLLHGLKACPSLVGLSIEDYFLLPREGASLAEFVGESIIVKKLRLTCNECFEMKQLETFFKGLASNRNLEELRLRGFCLELPALGLLVEAVASHSTLKILEVGCSDEDIDGDPLAELMARNTCLRELAFGSGEAGCVAAFARAIRKSTKLEKLTLSLISMRMHHYRELLMALSCNQSLQELELEYVLDIFLGDLCQLMRETGTEGRVKFEAHFEDALVLTNAMKNCSMLTEMTYTQERHGSPLPREAFCELVHCHQLKILTLYDLYMPYERECLIDLALFLSRTTSLKEAYLRIGTTAESTRVLLDALSRNQSISKLWIRDWTFEPSDFQQLYDLVRTNRNISELHLQLMNSREQGVIHLLAKHLYSNLCLLNVTVEVDRRYDSCMAQYQIRRATLRNSSMLHRAVQFVMGSRGRRFAEAFERIFDLPSLVRAVQKTANEPEEHAKEMVKSSKRYLDCNFLAAVGIVKDTVICEPNGRVQLDCVGLDNWLQIRQYLKAADIKPEPVVGVYRPRLPRKRSCLNRP
ncbi:unnamed protein product [Ixodes hexagonus]